MRKLLNVVARDYLEQRMQHALDEKEMDELGNALCLIAYYGGMLDMRRLAHYAGETTRKFASDIRKIAGKFYSKKLYRRAEDRQIWEDRAPGQTEGFLIALAAGLIEYGYWYDTPNEPESHLVARETIKQFEATSPEQFIPATIVSSRSELKGYVATIEYLWYSIDSNDDILLADWIANRYGKKSKMRTNIDRFLDVFIRYLERDPVDNPYAVLTELKIEARKNWQDCQNGLRPDWVVSTPSLLARASKEDDDDDDDDDFTTWA